MLYKMLHGSRYFKHSEVPCLFFTLLSGLVAGYCFAHIFSNALGFNLAPFQELKPKNNTNQHIAVNSINQPKRIASIAEQLENDVRILCWILTSSTNQIDKAQFIKQTWGKRCNIFLIMNSDDDDELPTVKLDIVEDPENLWNKVKKAFKYVYEHHYYDADWFYKADDETYAVVENMRYMLYPYNPDTPVYFGFKIKPFVGQEQQSRDAGYILSREALQRFVVKGLPNPNISQPLSTTGAGFEMASSMEILNVAAGDTRDAAGRNRVYQVAPEFSSNVTDWHYRTRDGPTNISDTVISLHYISANYMPMLDYLIYSLQPYGSTNEPVALYSKLALNELMPTPKIRNETLYKTEQTSEENLRRVT